MKHYQQLAVICMAVLSPAMPCHGENETETIRNFRIPTIERLGQELFKRDALAAKAFDLLFETHPEAKNQKLGGWITQLGKESSRVYLLKRADDETRLAYVAVFEKGEEPRIESHLGEVLPNRIAQRFHARTAAIRAIPGFYDRPYNFEVLDDPDGKGFIVYSLAATKEAHEIVVGGHSRITVSDDARTIEGVDALSKSLLILNKNPEKAGGTIEAAIVSHIVSNTPVETHVFLSLMHKRAFYVVTPDKAIWKVENGRILATDMKAERNGAKQHSTAPDSKSQGDAETESESKHCSQ